MITYAAMVWWPNTTQKTIQQQLQQTRRLTCLNIQTRLTAALLEITSLHVDIQNQSISSAPCISSFKGFKLEGILKSLKIVTLTTLT